MTTRQGNSKLFRVEKTDGIPRKAVLIDGLIHSREWMSGAVALYIINEVCSPISSFRSSPYLRHWLLVPFS